jgi:hypothetical protein
MQTRTGLGVDTCTYLPVERRNRTPPPTTPTTSRDPKQFARTWVSVFVSHLLEHSLYTVLHLKHLNFVLYKETPKVHSRVKRKGTDCAPRAAPSSSSDTRRPPPTTRIQSEAQDRVTGGFSNGRVPLHRVGYNRLTSL